MSEEQVKERVFKYGDQTWADPGAEYSVEEVRKQLQTYYPELARAEVKETELPEGRVQVEFVKKAGTKGASPRGRGE